MGAIDELVSTAAGSVAPVVPLRSRSRHPSHLRQDISADGTYSAAVPASASSDPRIRAFAAFIRRALIEAQDRGMSIEEVESRTGVPRSTMYRWRRSEITNPQREQVQRFCDGLGIPRTTAAQILGWDGGPTPTEPEPSVDPDLRAVMRKLNDPNTTKEAKATIRQMLRYLAREE